MVWICQVNTEHMERFYKKFGTEKLEESEEEGEACGIQKSKTSSKPSDFESLFSGTNADDFVFGIKFTK